MNLIIIAAIGKNGELGANNKLLWHLPNDLKFFKEKTFGRKVVMGRKTYESLPGLLPNREHIVISKNKISGVKVFNDIASFINEYRNLDEDIFVIGGGMIYKELLPYTNTMYLTLVDKNCDNADTFFPKINDDDWFITSIDRNEDNKIKYEHFKYSRRR